jgi:hypothetical protein
MSKTARKVADIAAENTESQSNSQATNTPAPVMQVLKPEAREEPEPEPEAKAQAAEPPKPVSISEIKRRAQEIYLLSEQHDNLTAQLEKVMEFAAEVGENATLSLSSDGVRRFNSKDPAAVAKMVEICISNIKERINEVEAKLAA